MDEPAQNPDTSVETEPIRPHVFDGNIREYDKRLPNWWLSTFWGAIAFALAYWVLGFIFGLAPQPGPALEKAMASNERMAASARPVALDDAGLWNMSRDPEFVKAGAATFSTTCASCHMPDLRGGIGPNLKDTEWIHGGNPLEIVHTITTGVLEKGMPTWGPILGQQKILEVSAFILSFHQEGEPIVKVPGWTPIIPGAPAVTQASQTPVP